MTAKAVSININDSDFCHYSARDSHGSGCSMYMVDRKLWWKQIST